jgi:hypothetical protein
MQNDKWGKRKKKKEKKKTLLTFTIGEKTKNIKAITI